MKIKNTELEIVKGDIKEIKADFIFFRDCSAMSLEDGERTIRLSMRQAFAAAGRKRAKKMLFPAIGCQNGFSLVGSAKIMTQEVLKYLRENKTTIKKIIFCLPTVREYKIFKKTAYSYVRHILYKLSEGPYVTVDAIIETKGGVVFIERSNPPYGLALPGGFVDYGESLEEAVAREAKEETNMRLKNLRQFHTYSKPDRDPRFHTIGTDRCWRNNLA